MDEGYQVKRHLDQFFVIVDKLGDLEIKVNDDLLAVMLLYSLPATFDNFRCHRVQRQTTKSRKLKSKYSGKIVDLYPATICSVRKENAEVLQR